MDDAMRFLDTASKRARPAPLEACAPHVESGGATSQCAYAGGGGASSQRGHGGGGALSHHAPVAQLLPQPPRLPALQHYMPMPHHPPFRPLVAQQHQQRVENITQQQLQLHALQQLQRQQQWQWEQQRLQHLQVALGAPPPTLREQVLYSSSIWLCVSLRASRCLGVRVRVCVRAHAVIEHAYKKKLNDVMSTACGVCI